MSLWTIRQLLEATEGKLIQGSLSQEVGGISIDSRRILPGEAFVAIRGTRLDGHDFLDEAAHQKASCLMVSNEVTATNGARSLPTILVNDTTEALGDLARFHRRRLNRPVIAVTGSCGKTTTKELIAHIIDEPENVLKTYGTQNNHIGVPLTLLRMTQQHQVAVVELGSNHPGEIAYLASIVEPNLAVITNVGPVHLEFLGSLMGVLHEKASLLDALPAEGSAIIPGDQLDVCLEAPRHMEPGVRVACFGTTDRCDIQAMDMQRSGESMTFRLRDQYHQWQLPMVGLHNIENTLAAIACGWAYGLSLSVIRERLRSFEAVPLRSEVLHCEGLTILNDCYNANPLSFARALETLRAIEVSRRVAIVGDMLELGAYAPAAHQAIGRLATQLGIDRVLAVGDYADDVAVGVRELCPDSVATYQTVDQLINGLPSVLREGDGLLVKGSRKLHLEQVTQFLVERYRGVDGTTAH